MAIAALIIAIVAAYTAFKLEEELQEAKNRVEELVGTMQNFDYDLHELQVTMQRRTDLMATQQSRIHALEMNVMQIRNIVLGEQDEQADL